MKPVLKVPGSMLLKLRCEWNAFELWFQFELAALHGGDQRRAHGLHPRRLDLQGLHPKP